MSRTVSNIPETSFGSSSPNLEAAGSTTEPSLKPVGLVLAGHHPLTLYGLSQVFEREPDCAVLAVCTDIDSILETVRRRQPDVLVLDLDRDGVFAALRRLHRARLSTRVVVLAAASDHDDMVDAVHLGAHAVVLKELPPEAFVACVRKVYAGEQQLAAPEAPVVSHLVKRRGTTRHVERRLTPRETEIAGLAVRGVPTRDIAVVLGLKQGTVKIHLHSIYEKLHVGGRLGLILFARRHGLG